MYYEILLELWEDHFEVPPEDMLLTNNGFGVMMMVFGDIMLHAKAYNPDWLDKKPSKERLLRESMRRLLGPVFEYLANNSEMIENIKSGSARGLQNNYAAILEAVIHEAYHEFYTQRTAREQQDLEPSSEERIVEKAIRAEKQLRCFLRDTLARRLQSDWWTKGIPPHLQDQLRKSWERQRDHDPSLKDSTEIMFEFTDIADMADIIRHPQNWDAHFKRIFRSSDTVRSRLMGIKALRDPTAHSRPHTRQNIYDAMSGLHWLSICIDQPALRPDVS